MIVTTSIGAYEPQKPIVIMENATLVAVAHGTQDPDGLAEIRRLINIVRTKRPGLPIELCWLDGAAPTLASLLPTLTGPVVVVPILLSTGYHVKSDIPQIVGDRPDTAIAAPLGPDPRISRVAYLRLQQARNGSGNDGVVLIAAGSSDPDARAELNAVARQIERWNVLPVQIGQLTDVDPFAGAHGVDHVANYLLAPGYFNDQLHQLADAEIVAEPIGAHPLVAEVILDRFDAAAASTSKPSSRMP